MNIFVKKKTFINSENKYFSLKIKYSWHQSKAAPVSFQCHRLSTVIHRQWQESVKCCCKQHAEGPSEIDVVQISRTEYITKCYRSMVEQIPQKRIYDPEINGNPIVYISDLTFEIRARAVRHVIMEHTRELPLEQKLNLYQVGDPIKRDSDLFKYGYIPYLWNSPFSFDRTVCHRNSAYKHTTWSTMLSRSSSDDATLVQFD